MKVNVDKTKAMTVGKDCRTQREQGRYPCGVCHKGVGNNSIKCSNCQYWCHKRCSKLKRLKKEDEDFICPSCKDEKDENNTNARMKELEFEQEKIEVVDEFCYLGEMMSCEAKSEIAVRTRIAVAWKKWKELASLLVNQKIPLGKRCFIYKACIRPVLLYGSEAWVVTRDIERLLKSCENRMLRYMTKIKWEDRITNEELWRMCEVEDLKSVVRRNRLRWFGHVQRREDHHIIKRAMNYAVDGRRPRGRPNKTWAACIAEDLRELGINEEETQFRERWRRLINVKPPLGEM